MSNPTEIQFHIRTATIDDVQTIFDFVTALAEHEKSLNILKITPQLIRENLFEKSVAHSLLAFSGPLGPENSQPIGHALYYFNYSAWSGKPGLYLDDLFITPEYRSKGVGKALFAELAKIAQTKVKCARMDWVVLKRNTASINFYRNVLGATAKDEWMGMRLEEEGIEHLKQYAKL